MRKNLPAGLESTLLWSDGLGMGWHTGDPISYDADYFAGYVERDATPMGRALTQARCEQVRRHYDGPVVDIGIGGGGFLLGMGDASQGYDVSGAAVSWLRRHGRFRDPYAHGAQALTCWDSLEHVPDPAALVACASEWVFLSMPIYTGQADCLASKHYKPGEHLWYWTAEGLQLWFARQGFAMIERNHVESHLGRHRIESYAFRRTEK